MTYHWTHLIRVSCKCCQQSAQRLALFHTLFSVFTWRHGGHVLNNRETSLLGIWFYYYAKLERHFAIVLYTNMAVSSREWKPRIFVSFLALQWLFSVEYCILTVMHLTGNRNSYPKLKFGRVDFRIAKKNKFNTLEYVAPWPDLLIKSGRGQLCYC